MAEPETNAQPTSLQRRLAGNSRGGRKSALAAATVGVTGMDVTNLDLSTPQARQRVIEGLIAAVVEGRCSAHTAKVIGELIGRAGEEAKDELLDLARRQHAEIERLRGAR
jgi:hypothetical protein